MAKYGWVQSNTQKKAKPSDQLKRQVDAAFKPVLEEATAKLSPIEEPQEFNKGLHFFGKWYRNFYYVYEKMKCPPNATEEEFDYGIARLRYVGDNKFNMACFRHTGEWSDLFTHEGMTLEECVEAVKTDPWFLSNYV